MVDIRRAIETLVPDAKWDFSIPNEGGDESQYNEIGWADTRPKPAWADLVEVAEGFAAADLAAKRLDMSVGPLQLRKALRQTGDYAAVIAIIAQADEETQEAWEYASEVRRLNPMIEGVRIILNKTPEEVDALFELASTL